jgi:hypothetical protein
MLEEADALGPVSIEGGVGVVASDALRFALRLTVPVAGQRRLFWQGALGAEVAF